jgi:hypothetical protein
MSKAKPGMIGFSNNKKGILPKLIRFFTDSHISHAFIITDEIAGQPAVQEASLLVQIVPLEKYYVNDDTQDYELYEIHPEYASKLAMYESRKRVFNELAGEKYGKLQLVWFPWRWFNEKVLRRDIRKTKNWMTDGVICSELQYWYLWYLGKTFQELLKDYNPDTIQAEDLRRIVKKNPHIFKLVERKGLEDADKGKTA